MLCKKQRNFCVNLLKKAKKNYYNNLDLKIFDDSKKFWERIIPLFSDKQNVLQRNIIIVEKEVIISDKKQVAEKLNNFFIEAVDSLDIEPYGNNNNGVPLGNIGEIINKYETHPSILKIKENDMTSDDFKKEISQLNPNKASIENDISAKMLIGSKDMVSPYLSNIYNDCKQENKYPLSLKAAEMTPIHKKAEKNCNEKLSSSKLNPNHLQIIRKENVCPNYRIY